ncbi:MAG: helix-turn-helix domain-containing protein [Zoogloea sp.]|nr:helix-turn-helix domain-containing protein [Zoogloea sp.]
MRHTREAQGLSVSEVAHALKLNPRQIEALEAGRFDLLPGYAFTRGFLRNYARLLKMDPAPLLAQLEPQEAGADVELAPSSNAQGEMPEVGRGRFRRSVIPGILAALALLGIVVAGWYYDTLRSRPAEELAASLPAPSEAAPPTESSPPVGAVSVPVPVLVPQADSSAVPPQLPAATSPAAVSVSGRRRCRRLNLRRLQRRPMAWIALFSISPRTPGWRSRTETARSCSRVWARRARGSRLKHVLRCLWWWVMPAT